jgi:hypothetical protein
VNSRCICILITHFLRSFNNVDHFLGWEIK